MINGSQSMHAVTEAGVSVRSADHKELLQFKTWDASLVSPGNPTPFPNGLFQPEMDKGVHFNLMNNIWGTNYVSAAAECKDAMKQYMHALPAGWGRYRIVLSSRQL